MASLGPWYGVFWQCQPTVSSHQMHLWGSVLNTVCASSLVPIKWMLCLHCISIFNKLSNEQYYCLGLGKEPQGQTHSRLPEILEFSLAHMEESANAESMMELAMACMASSCWEAVSVGPWCLGQGSEQWP